MKITSMIYLCFCACVVAPVTGVWALTLGEAVNAPSLTWTTGGTAAWFPETTFSHDGVAAAQSGVIGNSQQSWMQTTVEGPGTATFWWCVSSESGYDYLNFLLDGTLQVRISGEVAWQQKSLYIPAGSHELRWTYSKDGSYIAGSDCGRLDQVAILGAVDGGTSLTYQAYSLGGDGQLSGGETADLHVQLINDGGGALQGVFSSLNSLTPSVTVPVNASVYPDLASGMSGSNITPFVVNVASGFAGNANFQIVATAANAPGMAFTNLFSIPVIVLPDLYEPDNTRAAARYIAIGATQQHSLHTSTDLDYVGFVVNELAQVSIATAPNASAPDYTANTRIVLYNGGGAELMQTSTGGTGNYAVLATTLDPGTYYAAADGDGSGNMILYDLTAGASSATNFIDEYEPDNGWTNANFSGHGVRYVHSLYPDGDVDYRAFNMVGLQSIATFAATPVNPGDPAPLITLFDTNGITVLASGSAPQTWSNLYAGTFFYRVSSSGIIKKYETVVSIETLSELDGYEPDNATNEAHTAANGGWYNHSIGPIGDQDWRRFAIGETSDVLMVTSDGGSAPNGDTLLYMYAADGVTQIAMNDNDPYVISTKYSRIVQPLVPPGTYYAKVVEKTSSQLISDYDWYFAWAPADLGDAYEPDNAPSNAHVIANGSTEDHSLHVATDQDWVKFALATPQDVTLETSANGGWGGVTVLTLFNANFVQLAQSEYAHLGSTWSKIEYGNAPTGTYYVQVTGTGIIHGYHLAYRAWAAGPKIKGTVYGPDHTPISNPDADLAVDLLNQDGDVLDTVQPFADGTYVVYTGGAGEYVVQAYDANRLYAPHYFEGAKTFDGATVINAPAAGNMTGIDFALPLAGAISGVVYDVTGGPPAEAVNVIAVNLDNDQVGDTWTAADGSYQIDGLNSGMHRVYAEGGGYERRWHYTERGFEQGWPVVVANGRITTNINIVVPYGGTISGTVRGPGGAIIVQGTVRAQLFAWNGATFSLHQTQNITFTGTYAFAGLAPTSYKVCFNDTAAPVVFDALWYNGAADEATAAPLVLEQGQVVTGINAVLAYHVVPPATGRGAIHGSVTAADGTVLPGVIVRRYTNATWSTAVATGADGSYAFENLLPGTCVLGFEAPKYAPAFFDNSATYTGATPVVVNGGATNYCNAQLQVGGMIMGTIYDAYTFDPLAADVTLYDSHCGVVASSSGDDQLDFDNLLPGTYAVVVSAYGYWDCRTNIVVTSGRVTMQDVYLIPAPYGYISGTVRDERGNPVPNAFIYIVDRDGNDITPYGYLDALFTDFNGRYLAQVPEGYCRVFAYINTPTTSAEAWYHDRALVPVGMDEVTPNIDITLRQGAVIAGRVTYDNQGLANIQVVVFDTNNTMVVQGTPTDNQGYYHLFVPHGAYHLAALDQQYYVFAPQYYSGAVSKAAATVVALSAGAPAMNKDFALQPAAFIRGWVRTQNGAPCPNAWVTPHDVSGTMIAGDMWYGAATAADGSYAVPVPPGVFFVRADYNGSFTWQFYSNATAAAAATPVVVAASGDARNINFWLKTGGLISGLVQTPAGMPLANVLVDVFAGADTGMVNALAYAPTTDIDGEFALDAYMPAGSYNVRAQLYNSPYVATTAAVTVPDGTSVTTTITMATLQLSVSGTTTVYATDLLSVLFYSNGDDSTLRYAVQGTPPGAPTNLNAATHVFEWLTRTIDAGCYTCTVTATDGIAQFCAQPFAIIILPAAPTAVIASDGSYTNNVLVRFAPVDRATMYKVYRGTSPLTATMTEVSAVITTTDYGDVSAVPGDLYYYAAQAGHAYGWGKLSAVDSGFALFTINAGEWKYKTGAKLNKKGKTTGKDVLKGSAINPALMPKFEQGWQIGFAGLVNGAVTNWNGPYTLIPNKSKNLWQVKDPAKGTPKVAYIKYSVNATKGDKLDYQLWTNMPADKVVYILPTNLLFSTNTLLNEQNSNEPPVQFRLQPTGKVSKSGWQELKATVVEDKQ